MNKKKISVEVFFPFGACACSYATFLEKVGTVTSRFKNEVDVKMRSTTSKEAQNYTVDASCVIVGGKIRVTADFVEKQLEEAILSCVKQQA